jgi:hypothetical protein
MSALKKTIKKQFGELWRTRYPTFVHASPGHLLRRHGPLLLGIAIEPGSNEREYDPVIHAHCLAIESEDISLSLAGHLVNRHGVPDRVPRDPKDFRDWRVFERYEQQYPAITDSRFSFNDYVRLVRGYLTGKHGYPVNFQVWPYHDLLVVAAWCGLKEYALRALDRAIEATTSWEEACFSVVGGREGWRRKIVALARDPSPLEQTINSEVERHSLRDLPDHRLLIDDEPEYL